MALTRESKLIVFVAVLASLLEIIDTSIVNVAIPTMMGNLGATLEDISMVVTGYAIANAIVLPLSAWLGERFGRRPYFLGCIVIFTATSVACGLAPNLHTLIVFRILQGLAGGALLPTSQTLIYEQFPREKAGIAGAIFGMSVMIGPTLGPTLGGYLTDNFGWRSIFNINLPLGMLGLFVGMLVIHNVVKSPEEAAKPKPAMDVWGLVLLAAGIGCLQYTLERGEADDWFSSDAIKVCAAVAAFSLPMFVWWELKIKNPILNLRLFKDPIVTNGVMLQGLLGFFLYGLVFLLPVFAGRSLHMDATQIGMLFIPGSLITAALMPFVGRALQATDPRYLIAVGLVSIEVCLLMLTRLSTQSGQTELLHALYVRGIGMAFLFVPINSSILGQFKGPNLGQVSGMLNLFRQLGGSVGIALVGTLLATRGQTNYISLISKVSMLNPQTQMAVLQGTGAMGGKMVEAIGTASQQQATVRSILARVQNQAFMMSFNQLIWTVAFIFLLAFIPLVSLRFRNTKIVAVNEH